jgi:hypothetical protein
MVEKGSQHKEIDLNGTMVSVWKITNTENGLTFIGLKLNDRHLFVPINGGKSGDHAYNDIAQQNVESTVDRIKPVTNSATLMSVLFNGKRGDNITRAFPISGITGLLFRFDKHAEKVAEDITVDLISAYPHLKIEPVMTG